jgi:hypothetical protein
MKGMALTKRTVLFELELVRGTPLVFGGGIVPSFALGAGQGNDIPHE